MKINGLTVPGVTLASKPLVSAPAQKLTLLNPPGAHGAIDVSTVLSGGEPVWEDRTLTMQCYGHDPDAVRAFEELLAGFAGKPARITPDDQPGFYQAKRVQFTTFGSHGSRFGFTIVATVEPWRWADAFTSVSVTGSVSPGTLFTLPAPRLSVFPLISTSAAVTLVVGGKQWGIPAGVVDQVIDSGGNALVMTPGVGLSGRVIGSGGVTLKYRDGRLV